MTITLEIEVPDEVGGLTVKYTMIDALVEFYNKRQRVNEYMVSRYPGGFGGDHKKDEEKKAEVLRRCKIALVCFWFARGAD